MIHLRGSDSILSRFSNLAHSRGSKWIWLWASLIGALIVGHSLLIHFIAETRPGLEFAPRHELGPDLALGHPPALLLDSGDRVRGLLADTDNRLCYRVSSGTGQTLNRLPFSSYRGLPIAYIAPIGLNGGIAEFLVSARTGGVFVPLVVSMDSNGPAFTPVPVHNVFLARDMDGCAGKRNERYVACVERQPGKYSLVLLALADARWGEPLVVADSVDPIALPRLLRDKSGEIHITWKQVVGGAGRQLYNVYDPAAGRLRFAEHLQLGPASVYFGAGQRLYREDTGAHLAEASDGRIYACWNVSSWEPMFNVFNSCIQLVRVNSGGSIEGTWTIKGRDSFALSGDLAVDRQGRVTLFWEDYFNRRFHLYWSRYTPAQDGFSDPRPFTRYHGSQRLPVALMNSRGEVVVAWRELQGESDRIWMRSGAEAAPANWVDRWSLGYAGGGLIATAREIFMLMIYGISGALVLVARNALALVLCLIMFYLLERSNILVQCNFFLGMAGAVLVLVFLKCQVPMIYASPAVDAGFSLFASLFATLAAVFAAHKHWLGGSEELIYLKYIAIWMYCDSFISLLYGAPGVFGPMV